MDYNLMFNLSSTQISEDLFSRPCKYVNGPLIVGAGPSGLAVGACLREQGVPFVIIERSDCIASLWQKRTYDRLKLHLPKQFCQLPKMPFSKSFPEYPTKRQFIDYLESYASHFDINPHFNECVHSAKYDETLGLWRVKTLGQGLTQPEVEYLCRWLVVATGENAECVVPDIDGLAHFGGKVIHSSEYKSGDTFRGQKVLVVGCGNSGMEVSLDLSNHNAEASIVCRSSVHILPREIMGKSTFELSMSLMKWIPLWLVDKILLFFAWFILGDMQKYGLKRPKVGPLELKNKQGKTPVLDIGALEKIRTGDIKVVPGIKCFNSNGVELINGEKMDVDAVVLATGYRSNVPYWLQEGEFFNKNGFPKTPFPNAWKGKSGLYAVGFTRRGLAGASFDAMKIAQDIGKVWKEETMQKKLTISRHAKETKKNRKKKKLLDSFKNSITYDIIQACKYVEKKGIIYRVIVRPTSMYIGSPLRKPQAQVLNLLFLGILSSSRMMRLLCVCMVVVLKVFFWYDVIFIILYNYLVIMK